MSFCAIHHATPVTLTPTCCEQEYTHFCNNYCSKQVPWSDKFEFVNGWYILIIISDMLSIIGSILKIEIQTKVTENLKHKSVHVKYNRTQFQLSVSLKNLFFFLKTLTSYDICSIFLGTGTMFVWIGVIRYMGYFRKYNVSTCLMVAVSCSDIFCTTYLVQ